MSCKRNREPIFTSRPDWNESLLRKNVTRGVCLKFVTREMGKRKEKKGQKGGGKEKGKERKEKSIERRNEEMAESSGRSRLGTNSIGIATGGGTNKLDRDTERGGRKMAWKFGGD